MSLINSVSSLESIRSKNRLSGYALLIRLNPLPEYREGQQVSTVRFSKRFGWRFAHRRLFCCSQGVRIGWLVFERLFALSEIDVVVFYIL